MDTAKPDAKISVVQAKIRDDLTAIGSNIDQLKAENQELRDRLRDIAMGAVMMIPVTTGATRDYVREVYRMATENLP